MSKRRSRVQQATRDEIKAVARALMSEHGTAGISIRAIAREMDITAPALYHYYANMDALITDLLVDGFNASADAMQAAYEQPGTPAEKVRAIFLAYRQWALAHKSEFELLYGNPIPGYEAPKDVTIPAASRTQVILSQAIGALMMATKKPVMPVWTNVPPKVTETLTHILEEGGYPAEFMQAAYMASLFWAQGHGIIMLELHGHLTPTLGDMDAAYGQFIDSVLVQLGA
ncbi:MAG: hypothetical protein CL607_06530 [Anaerolineaceae bacterium]|nr:hypothetical protein [Anaerolineaceae bacterium]